jgi:small subunit ribosomal protein S16
VSVRIRLTRVGRKKIPHYRIVVIDSRDRRDGAYLEQIGVYHPNQQPARFEIEEAKALRWLSQGAVPSDTVRSLLSQRGIMLHFDLLKRQTPPEKIAEAVNRFREESVARVAQRAAAKSAKLKSKTPAGDTATAESPPTL